MIRIPLNGDGNSCRPEIHYPCKWQYKIIGESRVAIEELVATTLKDRPFTLTESNVSRTGRYISMNLELTVDNEEQRLELYRILAAGQHIKVVL